MLGLRTRTIALAIIVIGGEAAPGGDEACAQEAAAFSRPIWSVVGSLEGTHTNNAFFTPSDKQSDAYLGPDVTVRLDGTLTSEIFYRLYARMELDAFSSETDANNSVARVGARLSRDIFDWTASLVYENRSSFDGIFDERLFTAHDVMGVMARDFDCGFAILSPGGIFTYRFADVEEAQRYRLELWLGAEVPLDTRWSIVSEPFFESFWFTDGLNAGREDQIYSVSLGLKYNLSDNATLTTEAVYEGRSSDQAGRDYDMIEVGPRLDFAF